MTIHHVVDLAISIYQLPYGLGDQWPFHALPILAKGTASCSGQASWRAGLQCSWFLHLAPPAIQGPCQPQNRWTHSPARDFLFTAEDVGPAVFIGQKRSHVLHLHWQLIYHFECYAGSKPCQRTTTSNNNMSQFQKTNLSSSNMTPTPSIWVMARATKAKAGGNLKNFITYKELSRAISDMFPGFWLKPLGE